MTELTRYAITVTLDVTNFSNDYGEIENYAIWVREVHNSEDEEQLIQKPGKTAISWESVSSRDIFQRSTVCFKMLVTLLR